jgi:uncharacterized protein (DUF2141 family)
MKTSRRQIVGGRLRSLGIFLRVAVAVTAILSISSHAQSPKIKIAGTIRGESGRHTIFVALWDRDNFLIRPMQQTRISPSSAPMFEFLVPQGRWALSAFEDVNGNGILDMGRLGPKEPSGFWHAFNGWRKPRFDDVAVLVTRDTTDVQIELHK